MLCWMLDAGYWSLDAGYKRRTAQGTWHTEYFLPCTFCLEPCAALIFGIEELATSERASLSTYGTTRFLAWPENHSRCG
jgi:hypothetical protein